MTKLRAAGLAQRNLIRRSLAELTELTEQIEDHEFREQMAAVLEPLREDYDERDWRVVWDETMPGRLEMVPLYAEERRKKLQDAYWRSSPHIRRVIGNAKNYVVGNGVQFAPANLESKADRDEAAAFWKRWCRKEHFQAKLRETVERGALEGEVFWYWTEDAEGWLRLRFIESGEIKDQQSDPKKRGIDVDPEDPERVLRYHWCPGGDIARHRIISDPSLVQHIFWFGTRNMVRGIPPLLPVLDKVRDYDAWIRDRLILNKVRAAVVLIRRHLKATPSQIAEFAANKKAGTTTDRKTGEEVNRRPIKAGTILDVGGNIDYEFKSPNLQAGDVANDGRAVLLTIAAGSGQPEHMVSMDASNANFASTMVAEAPGMKEFESNQGVLEEEADEAWHRVMLWGLNSGRLNIKPPREPEPDDFDSGIDVKIGMPRLVQRDRLTDVKANLVLQAAAVMSKKTWTGQEGLDYEEEQSNIEDEADQSVGMPPKALPVGAEEVPGEVKGKPPEGQAQAPMAQPLPKAGAMQPGSTGYEGATA